MIQGKVLVTGATGDTGRATVEELLARGHQVRALAHGEDHRSKRLQERGVEVVFGDLLDFGEVRSALSGTRRAYFIYPTRPGIRPSSETGAAFRPVRPNGPEDEGIPMNSLASGRPPSLGGGAT